MATLIDTPEAANRLARAIASDVSLYNEAKIKEGIENDTFYEILADEIEEGRAHYKGRVKPELQKTTNFYERAIVDVILARKGHIKSKIW
jgi:spore germination protein GerM